MVVTFAPSTCQTKTVQDLTALPLTCTTQAPHCDVSQPTWVPSGRRSSRRYCTRRVRGSTSAVTALPFTVSAAADMASSSKSGQMASFFAPKGSADGGSGQNRADFAPRRGLEQVNSEPAARGWSRVLAIAKAALVVRFRSSSALAARSDTNFGIEGPLATL